MPKVAVVVALYTGLLLGAAEGRAQDDFDFGGFEDEETSPVEASPESDPLPEPEPAPEAAPAPRDEPEGMTGTDLAQEDRIRAVSRKTFLKRERFELLPYGGFSTNDSFFRRWSLGLRGSYHLVDSLSLEVGGAWNAFTEELESVGFLRRTQNAVTNDALFFGMIDAGVSFAPVYGKVAVLKEWIIHFDGYVTSGLGVALDSNASLLHPSVNVGVGSRIFVLPWLVVRGELRDYIYPQDRAGISAIQNLLMFNLGVGFYFPFHYSYRNQAFRIVG